MDELNNAPELPSYRPGDIVEMEVEISHRARMNIESVEVRFITEGGEGTNKTELTLTSGRPAPTREQPASGNRSWSMARAMAEVPMEQASGVYNLASITVSTATTVSRLEDDQIRLGLFDTSFEVVKGGLRPEILSGRFVT
ncbi:MAG: hypothetical protein M3M97_05805 [Actinomycetota bacterium]|nr:hypothetical protein [Actinomycetota bacterium]